MFLNLYPPNIMFSLPLKQYKQTQKIIDTKINNGKMPRKATKKKHEVIFVLANYSWAIWDLSWIVTGS